VNNRSAVGVKVGDVPTEGSADSSPQMSSAARRSIKDVKIRAREPRRSARCRLRDRRRGSRSRHGTESQRLQWLRFGQSGNLQRFAIVRRRVERCLSEDCGRSATISRSAEGRRQLGRPHRNIIRGRSRRARSRPPLAMHDQRGAQLTRSPSCSRIAGTARSTAGGHGRSGSSEHAPMRRRFGSNYVPAASTI